MKTTVKELLEVQCDSTAIEINDVSEEFDKEEFKGVVNLVLNYFDEEERNSLIFYSMIAGAYVSISGNRLFDKEDILKYRQSLELKGLDTIDLMDSLTYYGFETAYVNVNMKVSH